MYDCLRSPAKINRLVLKNRVVLPAMGTLLAAPDGGVSDDLLAFYEARARGGVGLIITGVTRVDDGPGDGEPCQLAARSLRDAVGLQRLSDAVHKYGTKLFLQLQHPGRTAPSLLTGQQPVAPSALAAPGGELPRPLTTAECGELRDKFVAAAQYAQLGGVDGVELHAAHGYLLNEFLSPAMNHRTDAYGGSFDNRLRLVCEIITGIHAHCGADYPVSVRINAREDLDGGIDPALAQRIAAALQTAGADAINVSCMDAGCIETGTHPEGCKRPLTQSIKSAVTIPVIGTSNIKQPSTAEALLRDGVCDLAAVGRAQLADPDWCRKAFAGREKEIRPCIGCLACFGEIAACRRIKCAVNPKTGREREYAEPKQDGAGRTVAIVGGGPAGIEAALVLHARGFAPVLFERESRLGGTLRTADKGCGKDKITRYAAALTEQMERAGVELRLNTAATVQAVAALEPAGVFLACGAEPLRPDIPGLDTLPTAAAEEVLLKHRTPTGRVVVIGSGMTGLETAELLAVRGCTVTLVELLPQAGRGLFSTVVNEVLERILQQGGRSLTGCRVVRVSAKGVEITNAAQPDTANTTLLPADWVVLAAGVRPRRAVVEEFLKVWPDAPVVGDAAKGGRILDATRDAHGAAFVFDPLP